MTNQQFEVRARVEGVRMDAVITIKEDRIGASFKMIGGYNISFDRTSIGTLQDREFVAKAKEMRIADKKIIECLSARHGFDYVYEWNPGNEDICQVSLGGITKNMFVSDAFVHILDYLEQ